jgi:hypothetical protein
MEANADRRFDVLSSRGVRVCAQQIQPWLVHSIGWNLGGIGVRWGKGRSFWRGAEGVRLEVSSRDASDEPAQGRAIASAEKANRPALLCSPSFQLHSTSQTMQATTPRLISRRFVSRSTLQLARTSPSSRAAPPLLASARISARNAPALVPALGQSRNYAQGPPGGGPGGQGGFRFNPFGQSHEKGEALKEFVRAFMIFCNTYC